MQYAFITTAVLVGAILASGGVQAKSAKANSIGNATVDDVTLNKDYSDALAFSAGVNPMQGPNGFSSAFAKTGTGTWSAIEKIDSSGATDLSKLFDFTFAKTSGTAGTWTITNVTKDTNAVLDLSVAIHAGNASTAFLFDNQAVNAGQTLSGTWKIDWLNGGSQVPGFSNFVVFARDLTTSAVKPALPPVLQPVPEPATLPMLGAGLAVLGLLARRRKK